MFSEITGLIRDILFSNPRSASALRRNYFLEMRWDALSRRVPLRYLIVSDGSTRTLLRTVLPHGSDVLFGTLVRKLGESKRTCRISSCAQERKTEGHPARCSSDRH